MPRRVADSFLFFLAFNYFREGRLNAGESSQTLPVLDEIGIGMLAGAFAKLWTTPVQNIVTRNRPQLWSLLGTLPLPFRLS